MIGEHGIQNTKINVMKFSHCHLQRVHPASRTMTWPHFAPSALAPAVGGELAGTCGEATAWM